MTANWQKILLKNILPGCKPADWILCQTQNRQFITSYLTVN